ncbi:MAG: hypothetical protein NUV53_04630 [Patescibacteria group bacterium]|nr:hypothetical protein [Patescibacteria group bacterium]
MEEQGGEKKVSLVETIYLLIIVGINSVVKIVADLSFGIPIIGQIFFIFAEFFTVIIWALILFFFVMKLGSFGAVGIAQVIGGILDMLGIPIGLLISTTLGIYLANHPKVTAVAQLATAKGAVSAEGRVAKEATAEGTAGEKTAKGTTARISQSGTAEIQTPEAGTVPNTPLGEENVIPQKPSISEESFGIEPEPLEKVRRLMENPLSPEENRDEESQPSSPPPRMVEDIHKRELPGDGV